MSAIRVRLHPDFAGAKFRPMTWHAITDDGAELKGYGVEVKGTKDRRYKLAAVEGDTIPFGNKKDADAWCKAANEKAASMLAAREQNGGAA
jgi:hypothetical protein